MKFSFSKGIWKIILGAGVSTLAVIAPMLLPAIIPAWLSQMTVGGLALELIDWLIHKFGNNK